MTKMVLTDELWAKVKDFIPEPKKAADGGGRPAYPRRQVLEGILWVLVTGVRWKDMPNNFPCYKTCHRLFQDWQRAGVFEEIFFAINGNENDDKSREGFIDGTFVPAKKGARSSAEAIRERAAQSWPSAMALVSLLDSVSMEQTNTRLNA